MPSGHTTATFGFAAAVSFATYARQRGAIRWAGPMLCFASAFLVAFARVYADQHWFSDVSAGALLGILSGGWLARIHARVHDSAFDRFLLGASTELT
jgi:undecaprenyl-diphosphatase